MLLDACAPVIGETVERPWVALSTLAGVEWDLPDDAGVDEALNVLVDRAPADAWIQRLEFVLEDGSVPEMREASQRGSGGCDLAVPVIAFRISL